MSKIAVIHGNNLSVLRKMQSKTIDLIYIDPPFNTGKKQAIHGKSYEDTFTDYLPWIRRRLRQAHRLLTETGSLFVHLDYREAHYVKVALDKIFGRQNFRNEIIWAYDYGGRSKKKWSAKHDTIFWYTKSERFTYNFAAIDRIPYMAPGLAGSDKAKRGKTPTDVWWNTIVHTTGKERVHYPTQKPLAILRRIVKVHSNKKDVCLDFFAGSGSFGHACLLEGRHCTLVDKNPQAIKVMQKRLRAS